LITATVIEPLNPEMDAIPVPKLTVSFAVDIEVEYNSFGGKTADEIAESLQDDLDNLLFELSPHVKGVYTSFTSVALDD
jgi:hypothetical protein